MRKQTTPRLGEEAALLELTSILPAGDRVRLAALGGLTSFSRAREKSLLRREKMLVARQGADSMEVRQVRQRLEGEKRLAVGTQAQAQRLETEVVSRNPDALILHGRVTNQQRLGIRGVTVSALDEQGKPVVFKGTNANGYFALMVPAGEGTSEQNVTLMVSDAKKAVLYRGCQCFPRHPGKVFYRELVIGTADPQTEPVPPPEVDPRAVTVPDVRGLEEMTARAQIRAVCLEVESTTRVDRDEVVGRVLEQNPAPGTKVAQSSVVKLVIGAASRVKVPDVVGKSLREAQAILKEAQLTTGRVEPLDASLGSVVVQQSPAAGSQVSPESAVDLVTREPLPQVTVPNVVRLRLADARQTLATAGLTLGKVEPASASGDSIVSEQSPAAHGQTVQGSAVNVKVRERAARLAVPLVVRLPLKEAKARLASANLKVGKVEPANAPDTGVVAAQDPAAGTEVDEGTAVNLVVRATLTDSPEPEPRATRRKAGAKPKQSRGKDKSST